MLRGWSWTTQMRGWNCGGACGQAAAEAVAYSGGCVARVRALVGVRGGCCRCGGLARVKARVRGVVFLEGPPRCPCLRASAGAGSPGSLPAGLSIRQANRAEVGELAALVCATVFVEPQA